MSVTWRSPGCFKLRSTLFKAALLIVLMARMAFVASGNSLLNVAKLEGGDSMHKEIGQCTKKQRKTSSTPFLLHSSERIPPCSVLCILSRRSPPRSSSCQCHKTAGSCPDNSILDGKTMLLWLSWWEVYQKHQACSSTCHQKKLQYHCPCWNIHKWAWLSTIRLADAKPATKLFAPCLKLRFESRNYWYR